MTAARHTLCNNPRDLHLIGMKHFSIVFIVIAIGAMTLARAEDISPERKAKGWLYIQGYKGHPHFYCRAIVTIDKDNQALCNSYKDYDSTHDKDAKDKFYVCTKGWDCDSYVDPK
jgi:hypothetical protein